MEIAWQLILRARDSRVLAPDSAQRRAWSRTLGLAAVGQPLLAHGLADTHGHLLVVCDRSDAGRLARGLGRTLHACLQPEIEREPVRLSPVCDQAHLANAFAYVLGQLHHHGLRGIDPYLDGTALPDLLGLRPLGAWMATQVRRHLPRVGREELLGRLRVDPWSIPTRELSALAEAVAAAAGQPCALGRSPLLFEARMAGVALAREGFESVAVAEALGLTDRAVRRLRTGQSSAVMRRAVEGQWAWRSREVCGGRSGPL